MENSMKKTFSVIAISALVAACGSLEKKSALINVGDDKQQVISVMGTPDDRQVKGSREVWQYCQTGAGFGYHDYRAFSFDQGKVTAINSYKSGRPGSSCMTDIRVVNWGDSPDQVIEVRHK
jgi:hypothetical protein